ncbi:HAD family acid phosphatase [Streptomyces sp. NPDC049954]|uniref:HAD family acid phosphatase n=1 Tax=Streptomyces sp. NPDC049954 TaxID=3155779 RepID=UPI00343422D4
MRKSLQVAGVTAACALAGTLVYGAGAAGAHGGSQQAGHEPQNIGLLVGQIDDYYGAQQQADGTWTASEHSDYAKDLARVESRAKADIRQATARTGHEAHGKHGGAKAKPAIVLDIDDTALLSFDYERRTNYVYDNDTWNAYVDQANRPAVFGMPELVSYAKQHGVEVFFLTGLSEPQRPGAAKNLAKVGYDTQLDKAHLFLKDKANPPAYLKDCASAAAWNCTTVQYKAGTRKHLEDSGYRVIGNFGDQQSDLTGGYADKGYKLPNPTYFVE